MNLAKYLRLSKITFLKYKTKTAISLHTSFYFELFLISQRSKEDEHDFELDCLKYLSY